MDFLRAAVRMCPNVACVLTKTDLYPQWRRIAELDRGHLAAADVAADLIPVSSAVRQVALQTKSKSLNEESGFPPSSATSARRFWRARTSWTAATPRTTCWRCARS